MKHSPLTYRQVSRDELAEHLGNHDVISAEVCASVTVYRCQPAKSGSETLAIALPDGSALIVGTASNSSASPSKTLDRRRNRH